MEVFWKSPKVIIGKEATGNRYYVRKELEDEIWEEIKKGNNILLVAPRRVGKTSIMKSLASNQMLIISLSSKIYKELQKNQNFTKSFMN